MAKVHLLITGGLGFVGYHFVHWVTKKYPGRYTITVVDTGKNLPPVPWLKSSQDLAIHLVSVDNIAALAQIFATLRVDAVIHLAALHDVAWCHLHPKETFRINTQATFQLYQLASKFGVEHFVFASSSVVYGAQDGFCKESDIPDPTTIYAQSKWQAEQALMVGEGTPYTILRFFNLYGPYAKACRIVPLIQKQLVQTPGQVVLRQTKLFRDYIHVLDVVEAIDAVLFMPKAFGEVYNVGTGIATSTLDLLAAFETSIGSKISVVQEADEPSLSGCPLFVCADVKKMDKELNWRAQISLDSGIRALMQNMVIE